MTSNHAPAIRVNETEDWAMVLKVERAFDIDETRTHLAYGYRLKVMRDTAALRWTVTDGTSIAPVGSLVCYRDDQGKGRLRVEGRRGEVIRDNVASADVGLAWLGEYLQRADQAHA